MNYTEDLRLNDLISDSIYPVAENYVTFLKKYYEYMNLEDNPSNIINRTAKERDLEKATTLFLNRLYSEIGGSYFKNKDVNTDTATILANLNTIYRAKGSLESINALFSIVFNEKVEYWLPKEFLFKTSAGDWQQDYSVTCSVVSGDVFDLEDTFVNVESVFPGQTTETFETEIKKVELLDNTVVRLFLPRTGINAFFKGSIIRSKDNTVECVVIGTTNILLDRVNDGEKFERGRRYEIDSYERNTFKDELPGYSQGAIDRLEKYFNTVTSQRRYLEDGNRLNKYGIEQVTRKNYVDGLVIEDVVRDYEQYRIVKYGQKVNEIKYGSDGSRRISKSINTDLPNAPSPLVDWDLMIEELLKVHEGITTGSYYTFFTEKVNGISRGDTNQDGVIDLDDIEIFVRYLMGYQIKSQYRDWIKEYIDDELVNTSPPPPKPVLNNSLEILPLLVGNNGEIEDQKIVKAGYDYPDTFVSLLQSGEGNDPAVFIITSEVVSRIGGYYDDVTGFTSNESKIYDDNFYQDFSYVVRSSISYEQFRDPVYKMIHPAGMKVFSEQVISQEISIVPDVESFESTIFNTTLYDKAYPSDSFDGVTPVEINSQADLAYPSDSGQISTIAYYIDNTEGLYVEDGDVNVYGAGYVLGTDVIRVFN